MNNASPSHEGGRRCADTPRAEKAGIACSVSSTSYFRNARSLGQGIQKTLPEILSVKNGAAPRWVEVKWIMLPYTPGQSSYRCRASINSRTTASKPSGQMSTESLRLPTGREDQTCLFRDDEEESRQGTHTTEQGVHRVRRAQPEKTASTSSSCQSSSPCSWAEEQNELDHDDASGQSELLNGTVQTTSTNMPAQPRLSCTSHTDESQQISSPRNFIGKLTRPLVGLMEYINSPRVRPQFNPSNPRYSGCQIIVNSNPPILAELHRRSWDDKRLAQMYSAAVQLEDYTSVSKHAAKKVLIRVYDIWMNRWTLWSESFQVEANACKPDQPWLRKNPLNPQLPAHYYRDKLAKHCMRRLKNDESVLITREVQPGFALLMTKHADKSEHALQFDVVSATPRFKAV